jgi:hypothetical protein
MGIYIIIDIVRVEFGLENCPEKEKSRQKKGGPQAPTEVSWVFVNR